MFLQFRRFSSVPKAAVSKVFLPSQVFVGFFASYSIYTRKFSKAVFGQLSPNKAQVSLQSSVNKGKATSGSEHRGWIQA